MRWTSRTALCFVALAVTAAPSRADELDDRIKSIITAPQYKSSRWGILAVDMETKKPVYAHNADMLFAPASVSKLYSCTAAMIAIGPDHRYETPVYRRGEVTDGTLKGDLILVAQGDLTLGGRTLPDGKLAFKDSDHIYASYYGTGTELTDTDPLQGLNDLAKQVKAAGIRTVDGEVLIDDRLFNRERGSGSGPTIVTPIMVNDNLIDLVVIPGAKAGDPATVRMRPETELYRVESKVQTMAKEKTARIRVESKTPGLLMVTGQIGASMKPVVRIHPVEDPALFARAFHRGVAAQGST